MENDKRLERLEEKVDKLTEYYHNQNTTLERLTVVLEKNTDSLITHEKRTTLAEDKLDKFEMKFEKHLSFLQGTIWVIGGIGGLLAIAFKVIELLQKS